MLRLFLNKGRFPRISRGCETVLNYFKLLNVIYTPEQANIIHRKKKLIQKYYIKIKLITQMQVTVNPFI